MPKVSVGENEPLEKALRRFKKKIEIEGILKTEIKNTNPKINLFLANYLNAKSCGVIEEAIEQILCSKAKQERLPRYMEAFFIDKIQQYFRNPEPEHLKKLLDRCDPRWYKNLEKTLARNYPEQDVNQLIGSLNSIVIRKNGLVHQGISTFGSNTEDIIVLIADFKNAKKVIEVLDWMLLS